MLAQRDADVLPLWMQARVSVVPYPAFLCGEDAVVASEFAVFAWVPVGAALAEYGCAWDYVFACGKGMG